MTGKSFNPHVGGAKKLSDAMEDFSLTMQHALRQDLRAQLELRAKEEAGILPEFTLAEMFDYLCDSDPEFYNFCFPYCAIRLTPENVGYLHAFVLKQFRLTLEPVQTVTENAAT